MKYFFILIFFLGGFLQVCRSQASEKVVYNGIPWFDDRGEIVNAHGACIVEDGGRYYLFGEYKSHGNNNFCRQSDSTLIWTEHNKK